jgi:GNAT superfamily N-acetyltransferase
MIRIAPASTLHDIRRCLPILTQLRPDLVETGFVARIRRQEAAGYRLVFLEAEGRIQSVAGYRISENLAWGRFLYVDDLVTDEAARGKGYGRQLLDWLVAQARAHDCDQLHLDSGVQRLAAHRFYLAHRLDITSHHFALKLK